MSRFYITSLLLVAAIIMGYKWANTKESPKIDIELTTSTPVVESHQTPQFSVTLVNRDKYPVTLVKPGDGSFEGLCTPVISWSIIDVDDASRDPRQPGIGCGNMNPLRRDEVFTLDPGEKITFNSQRGDWIRPSQLYQGTYQVSLNYSNVPKLKWQNSKIRYNLSMWQQFTYRVRNWRHRNWRRSGEHHDRVAMEHVRKSTPFKGTSNSVKIVVKAGLDWTR